MNGETMYTGGWARGELSWSGILFRRLEVLILDKASVLTFSDSWLQIRVYTYGGILRSREANYTCYGLGNENMMSGVILLVGGCRCWPIINLRFQICGEKLLQMVCKLVNIMT